MVVGADEVRLAGLVGRPANGSAWHRSNNSWANTLEEALGALALVKKLAALDKTGHVSQLSIARASTGLQHRLNDVHWSGQGRCKTTSNTTSNAVSDWVVVLLWVHDRRDGLVGQELKGVERHSHRERGWIGDVEGTKTLSAVHGASTRGHVWVESLRALNLHTLLDDLFLVRLALSLRIERTGDENIPSKGFINASEAIVAQAPEVAEASGWCTPA